MDSTFLWKLSSIPIAWDWSLLKRRQFLSFHSFPLFPWKGSGVTRETKKSFRYVRHYARAADTRVDELFVARSTAATKQATANGSRWVNWCITAISYHGTIIPGPDFHSAYDNSPPRFDRVNYQSTRGHENTCALNVSRLRGETPATPPRKRERG